ncbi:hypothetical protein R2R35_20035 [Anaerocolumna sp. AGMB13020]|nr:hypothetical protein [Anaerocolumna sp. AGMB13020]WOO35993.1 hypothetical protein R2R35_19680 [Anaerocolumna sp. AGMB13020]WOO36063.1 hypothetical protein R2R35_20035 [Anaerocolumna sp. AGMB13020]
MKTAVKVNSNQAEENYKVCIKRIVDNLDTSKLERLYNLAAYLYMGKK